MPVCTDQVHLYHIIHKFGVHLVEGLAFFVVLLLYVCDVVWDGEGVTYYLVILVVVHVVLFVSAINGDLPVCAYCLHEAGDLGGSDGGKLKGVGHPI